MRRMILLLAVLLVLAAAIVPASAQNGAVWTTYFFNNAFLLEPPVLTRQDTAVAFNWGSGSPAPGVLADNFTVRFATDVYLPAATYRFWALADDEVRVTVDYQFTPLIDTFGNPRVGQTLSGDLALNAGMHHVQVDYREAGGNAFVYATWADLATNPSGPSFPAPGIPSPSSGPWTAQYYANNNLSGTPTLIQSEGSPTHDWGSGSPVASIPSDNFSGRWTSSQTLNAATYQISARADDGVRVFVDGVSVINEWHSASGVTYTVNVNLSAGQHNFMIEYYEAGGLAFLNYTFTLVGSNPPPPITGPAATVTGAFKLNVRATPDPVNGAILTRINRNETYPIVGRNSDSSWWQINVNGIVGWVSARYVTAANTGSVPVTSGVITPPVPTQPPVITGAAMTVTGAFRLNVRATPDPVNGVVVVRINRNETYPIVGRNSDSSWWQINVNGTVGWVNARYVTAANTGNVPVTSQIVPTVPTGPVVQCPGFVPSRLVVGRQGRVTLTGSANNIRSTPGLTSAVIGLIPSGGVFSVLAGPQCSGGIAWWQVNFNGVVGWTAEGQGSDYWLEPL